MLACYATLTTIKATAATCGACRATCSCFAIVITIKCWRWCLNNYVSDMVLMILTVALSAINCAMVIVVVMMT